ncbi:MAG: hypothetical protein HC938_15570 [Nitrospira sp.]|nr:hypothetical protein [Nitrospira sp.]
MRSHLARIKRLLRNGAFAILVLGLMIKPVLSELSRFHAAEHAMEMDEHADSHGHPHGHAQDPHPDDSAPTEDHGSLAHGLMHQPGGHTTLELAVEIRVPPAPRHALLLPDLARTGLPQQPPSNPFRPPIA